MASGQGLEGFRSPRDTQRAPRSCVQCSRRKIKCSKRIPCEGCIRRGDAESCIREIVKINGRLTIAVDPIPDASVSPPEQLVTENLNLRARIEQLEGLLTASHVPFPEKSENDAHPETPEEIVSTFQGLHLGGPEDSTSQETLMDPMCSENILSLLPIRQSSLRIVHFSLGTLGWVHCALNAPKFLAEHEAFWNSLELDDRKGLENHGWMAVYLSVLAVGAYFMVENASSELHYLHEGFSGQQAPASAANGLVEVSHTWYEATLRELNRSNFFSKPQLSTVQALGILGLLHRNFGEMYREYFLLGLAINVARTLGLDHLSQEGNNVQAFGKACRWKERADRELSRRLWWTLVICDWMMIFSRPSSITLGSFNSSLDLENDSSHQDVVFRPTGYASAVNDWRPSPLEYHFVLSKIAHVINAHGRSVKASPPGVRETLRKLDRISQELPDHLQSSEIANFVPRNENFQWIPIQRSALDGLLQACRISLCFSSLPHLLETGEDEFCLQESGRQAATRLVETQQWTQTNLGNKLWGTTASLIAAGMFLLLDLMCFKNSKSVIEVASQLETIHLSIHMLESASTSRIDGSAVLKRLLHLHNISFASQPLDSQTLLKIMRHASVQVVKPAAMNKTGSIPNGGSTRPGSLAQQLEGKINLSAGAICHAPAPGQAFSFPAIGEPFDGAFGIDPDYMNFDLEQVLPSIIFSDGGLDIFDPLLNNQLQ